MSDIHHVAPSFTSTVADFAKVKDEDKHIRYDNKRKLHVHDGILPSRPGETAQKKREAKQEAGANGVRELIIRDYGQRVADYLCPSNQKTITVAELRNMKAKFDADPQLALFEFIKDEAHDAHQITSFLRNDTPRSRVAGKHVKEACGEYFATLCGKMAKEIGSGGVAAMTEDKLKELDEKDRKDALDRAINNLTTALPKLFGGTDSASIKRAAALVPQEYCDMLATALLAVAKDPTHTSGEKEAMRKIVLTNFGALRVINPELTLGMKGLDTAGRTAVVELAKQIQNICNGVKAGPKEKLVCEKEFNALVDQWAPIYQKFMEEVAARGKSMVT
jgi:hypothetical protein